jgi:putative heme-binding domain-containing protein
MLMKTYLPLAFSLVCCLGCRDTSNQLSKQILEKYLDRNVTVFGSYAVVKLPVTTGVRIWNPVQIVSGPDNLMYAANHTGEIYSLRDTDGDGLEDHATLFCDVKEQGLRSPASIAFKGRDLYVGTAQEVRVYTDTDGDLTADENRIFLKDIPHSEHPYEWSSALTFGSDGQLYLVLTTDSWNAGASPDPEGWRGSMLRISPDGKKVERFATGVRSVAGMVLTEHNDLLFVDNEGGGNPTEELNVALQGHFYGHNPVKFGDPDVTKPIYNLQTEVAPAGMEINPVNNDFGGTGGDLFIAFYGPGERWNRGAIGRLELTRLTDSTYNVTEFPVAKGIPKVSDLAFGANGDLYVSHVGKTDYWYQPVDTVEGAFYRLIHAPWVQAASMEAVAERSTPSESTLELGKDLFARSACSACHSVDGKSELLGPDLKDIGHIYSREELLEEIKSPSVRIKPSMIASKITDMNGEVLLGRIVSSDVQRIRLMVIGNRIIDIPRSNIKKEEFTKTSLMYEGLLNGMTQNEIEALLSYLMSLHEANEAGG